MPIKSQVLWKAGWLGPFRAMWRTAEVDAPWQGASVWIDSGVISGVFFEFDSFGPSMTFSIQFLSIDPSIE
ncbi:hypothetical protein CES87_29890 [Pseudomonas sp. ERMR1:02]|nr:hypothetical protein CES87_29890 [Pseudomonas sp. ERMR1:02]